jgi:hypothetical protein
MNRQLVRGIVLEVKNDPGGRATDTRIEGELKVTGRALNSGGVVFGLGYPFQEEILFDNGKSSPPISASSRLPTSWTFRR